MSIPTTNSTPQTSHPSSLGKRRKLPLQDQAEDLGEAAETRPASPAASRLPADRTGRGAGVRFRSRQRPWWTPERSDPTASLRRSGGT